MLHDREGGYLGVRVVQVLLSALIPGCIPVNAAVALTIQLPSYGSCQRRLLASASLAIHITHWQIHLHKGPLHVRR